MPEAYTFREAVDIITVHSIISNEPYPSWISDNIPGSQLLLVKFTNPEDITQGWRDFFGTEGHRAEAPMFAYGWYGWTVLIELRATPKVETSSWIWDNAKHIGHDVIDVSTPSQPAYICNTCASGRAVLADGPPSDPTDVVVWNDAPTPPCFCEGDDNRFCLQHGSFWDAIEGAPGGVTS